MDPRNAFLLLLKTQIPPQPIAPKALLIKKSLSKVLSERLSVCIPLQQLRYTVIFLTVTYVLDRSKIPQRSNFWITPGPSIWTSVLPSTRTPTPNAESVPRLQLAGGSTGPVIVCPLSLS